MTCADIIGMPAGDSSFDSASLHLSESLSSQQDISTAQATEELRECQATMVNSAAAPAPSTSGLPGQ